MNAAMKIETALLEKSDRLSAEYEALKDVNQSLANLKNLESKTCLEHAALARLIMEKYK